MLASGFEGLSTFFLSNLRPRYKINPVGKKDGFKTFYALSFAWQLGFLIAVPLAGFMFLGFLADEFFGVSPLFLIAGFAVGTAATVYEVRHLLAPLIKKKKGESEDEHD